MNVIPSVKWGGFFSQAFWQRVKNASVTSRLARGAFWSLMGAIISKGLQFSASIIIARFLGKVGFGELGILQNTIGMFGVIAGFGLGLTATKYVAEFKENNPHKAGRIIMLSHVLAYFSGGLMALVLLILSPWLAKSTLAAPHLTPLLQLSAGYLLLSAVNGMQNGVLAGFEEFKQIARINFFSGLVTFPLMVGGVYFAGLQGVVWGMLGSAFFCVFISHLVIKAKAKESKIPLKLSESLHERVILWRFSFPTILSEISVSPVKWASAALLVNRVNGYAEMGIFNVGLVCYGFFYIIGTVLSAPLLPILASDNSPDDKTKRINMLFNWFIGVFMAVPLLSFPEIFEYLYGVQFMGESFRKVFILILFVACINMYKQGLARVLAVNNMMWWGFLSNTVWGVLLLSSSYFLVRWGAVGLAISYAFAYTINTLIFVPLYTSRNLAPKSSLISWEAGIIWLSLGGLMAAAWFNCSLSTRFLAFLLSLLTVSYSFYRLLGLTLSKTF